MLRLRQAAAARKRHMMRSNKTLVRSQALHSQRSPRFQESNGTWGLQTDCRSRRDLRDEPADISSTMSMYTELFFSHAAWPDHSTGVSSFRRRQSEDDHLRALKQIPSLCAGSQYKVVLFRVSKFYALANSTEEEIQLLGWLSFKLCDARNGHRLVWYGCFEATRLVNSCK